jgi:hypothetical protein
MNLHDRAGLRRDGATVVVVVSPIGRADFDQLGAAARHDVRDPEAPPDLDQLAPRDEDFLLLGEGIESQHDRRGAVVHHECVFGAGEAAQQVDAV